MILSKKRRRLWNNCIRRLKENFPVGVPVTVRTVPMKGFNGDCSGIVKLGRLVSIEIRINSLEPWQVRMDSLIHEWAHAMEWPSSWWDDSVRRIHNETWGVWYAKIYQYLFDRC